jgi:hypothetical protein
MVRILERRAMRRELGNPAGAKRALRSLADVGMVRSAAVIQHDALDQSWTPERQWREG